MNGLSTLPTSPQSSGFKLNWVLPLQIFKDASMLPQKRRSSLFFPITSDLRVLFLSEDADHFCTLMKTDKAWVDAKDENYVSLSNRSLPCPVCTWSCSGLNLLLYCVLPDVGDILCLHDSFDPKFPGSVDKHTNHSRPFSQCVRSRHALRWRRYIDPQFLRWSCTPWWTDLCCRQVVPSL